MPLDQLMTVGLALPIVRWDAPMLHKPARPVQEFGPDLWNLIADMFATNRAADGAGLAAPQVGVDLAVFVYDTVDDRLRRHAGVVCNPSIEVPTRDRRVVTEAEGCLSLPGAYSQLPRPFRAICDGQDQFGQPISIDGTGYLARCLLHETDHLSGIVLEDRLSARARALHRRAHAAVAEEYGPDWPAR